MHGGGCGKPPTRNAAKTGKVGPLGLSRTLWKHRCAWITRARPMILVLKGVFGERSRANIVKQHSARDEGGRNSAVSTFHFNLKVRDFGSLNMNRVKARTSGPFAVGATRIAVIEENNRTLFQVLESHSKSTGGGVAYITEKDKWANFLTVEKVCQEPDFAGFGKNLTGENLMKTPRAPKGLRDKFGGLFGGISLCPPSAFSPRRCVIWGTLSAFLLNPVPPCPVFAV